MTKIRREGQGGGEKDEEEARRTKRRGRRIVEDIKTERRS